MMGSQPHPPSDMAILMLGYRTGMPDHTQSAAAM